MSRDALVVGINKYPFLKDSATGNYKHLTTPATDAEAIAQLLETHGNFRVKRFPGSNIDGKLQVDPDKLVKTEELEAAILDLFLPESGKPPETALLFFAGHGLRKQLRQSLTQGFLGTSDASPSKNLWGLSLRELWEILQQSQAQQQVIWLDCCFSGELLNFKDTELGRHSSGCDRFLIAASRDYEVAYQQLDGKHGVLTGALLAGLNPHLVPEFEWITNRTLTVSVEQKLQVYYETTKIPQSPLISNHGEAIKLIQGRAKPHSQNQSDAKNFQNLRLEPYTLNELVKLLRPFLEDERNRRPFLVLALGNDEPVLQHISWGGAVAIFIPDMVCKLADSGEVAQGKQALWALLEYVRSQVGIDVQQRIDNLRPLLEVRSRSDSEGVSPSSIAIDTTSIDALVHKVRDRIHDDIQRLYGTMPLLGVDHWVDLGELFVDVNILEKVSSSRKSELNDLWQDFSVGVKEYSSYRSLDRIGLGKQQHRVSGFTVLAKNTNLMVLGKPGSGKTTYLQRIVTECNEGRLQPQRIPILIKLREFVDDGRRFEHNLECYLTQQWRLSDAETKLVLSQGRGLILLDGLDEISRIDGGEICKQIKRFARVYPHNQLIMTCRTQSQESRFERFDYVEVADFSEAQVNIFVEHWFKAACSKKNDGQAKSRQFLDKLYLEENQPIQELAITPILLSLSCAVFQAQEKFYSKRSKLYEEGLELLLEKWDKDREIDRAEIYGGLSLEKKWKLLSYIAVKKFEQQQYVLFEQEELEKYIADFLQISHQDSRVVLRAIEAQHGLLIERAQRIWSFSHLTFQEYFISREFVNNYNLCNDNEFYLKMLCNQITNKRWWEVFLLTAELLLSSDKMLLYMKREVDKILAYDGESQRLLAWITQKCFYIDEEFKKAAVRAYFLMFFINKSAFFIIFEFEQNQPFWSFSFRDVLVNTFSELSKRRINQTGIYKNKLILGFDSELVELELPNQLLDNDGILEGEVISRLSCEIDLLHRISFIKALPPEESNPNVDNLIKQQNKLKTWWIKNCQYLLDKIDADLEENSNLGNGWQFNTIQQQILKQYYNGNLLLVKCLNSSYQVSNEIRQEIEDTLLLPISEIEKYKTKQSNSG
ncbi:NACHT domain-containing protein [Nostoc muscorum FACHB-395]|nr:NACHT domain-containing protein [Desmonostoc muscorum FACHB-395]